MESFARLVDEFDLVIVEGAGSPAEVNLRAGDIANMGFARRAEVPVCLVGDIDRGGVIAAVVGTGAVLDAADRALIAGFLINKLRGDPALFEDGVRIIERHTGWPCLGVIPWEPAALRLPAEEPRRCRRPDARRADGCGSPHRCCRVWRTMTTPIRCVWSRTWTSRSWRPASRFRGLRTW